MFILKKGHQPGVYVPLRALFLVLPTTQLQVYFLPFKKKYIFYLYLLQFYL